MKEWKNAIIPCSAFSVKHRQRAAIALLAAVPGVLKDAFSLCVTLCTLIKKKTILVFALKILWMNNSFIIPREILQSENQWLWEITWRAAEEKQLMGKGEAKGIDGEIKSWRKHVFKKQVKKSDF